MATLAERGSSRGWRSAARAGLRGLSMVFLVGVAAQFFLAGIGVFGAESFDPHIALGTLLGVISLLMLVLAVATRTLVAASGALFVLVVLQFLFAGHFGYDEPWVGALHVVNALAVTAVAYELVRRGSSLQGRER